MAITKTALGVVVTIAGVVVAVLFLLMPLPTIDAFGVTVGYCGPGLTSSSAARVLLQPELVQEDGPGARTGSIDDQYQLGAWCQDRAKRRALDGALLGGGLTLAGLALLYIAAPRRGRS